MWPHIISERFDNGSGCGDRVVSGRIELDGRAIPCHGNYIVDAQRTYADGDGRIWGKIHDLSERPSAFLREGLSGYGV
ncbi:hypothetical protein GCM10009655_03090 [Rhodoglobus aureus]|uniref:PAC domain-containing protein n=1 Tax=Rhodoglobus aureus TaxID=191497 RepID=A0ABN1VFP1_9MICO